MRSSMVLLYLTTFLVVLPLCLSSRITRATIDASHFGMEESNLTLLRLSAAKEMREALRASILESATKQSDVPPDLCQGDGLSTEQIGEQMDKTRTETIDILQPITYNIREAMEGGAVDSEEVKQLRHAAVTRTIKNVYDAGTADLKAYAKCRSAAREAAAQIQKATLAHRQTVDVQAQARAAAQGLEELKVRRAKRLRKYNGDVRIANRRMDFHETKMIEHSPGGQRYRHHARRKAHYAQKLVNLRSRYLTKEKESDAQVSALENVKGSARSTKMIPEKYRWYAALVSATPTTSRTNRSTYQCDFSRPSSATGQCDFLVFVMQLENVLHEFGRFAIFGSALKSAGCEKALTADIHDPYLKGQPYDILADPTCSSPSNPQCQNHFGNVTGTEACWAGDRIIPGSIAWRRSLTGNLNCNSDATHENIQVCPAGKSGMFGLWNSKDYCCCQPGFIFMLEHGGCTLPCDSEEAYEKARQSKIAADRAAFFTRKSYREGEGCKKNAFVYMSMGFNKAVEWVLRKGWARVAFAREEVAVYEILMASYDPENTEMTAADDLSVQRAQLEEELAEDSAEAQLSVEVEADEGEGGLSLHEGDEAKTTRPRRRWRLGEERQDNPESLLEVRSHHYASFALRIADDLANVVEEQIMSGSLDSALQSSGMSDDAQFALSLIGAVLVGCAVVWLWHFIIFVVLPVSLGIMAAVGAFFLIRGFLMAS